MMKNKIALKKLLYKIGFFSIIILIISLIVNITQYKKYTKNLNSKLSIIIYNIQQKYPDLSDNDIIEILNSNDKQSDFLKKYNIDINSESAILGNDKVHYQFIILNSIVLFCVVIMQTLFFLKFNRNKDKELNNITKYIREINKKNYKLDINDMSEDDLSILKNEIYKTTIMLKEESENSKKEKLELKTSLSDISHQLKTPLTSILIILDNLIDDNNMDKDTRQDFIIDIKKEINDINFLIQNLLKLSKLDTNSVTFNKEKISLKEIVTKSIDKLSMLCDLKHVIINLKVKNDGIIISDLNWQVEAISNIIKNCVEHSKENKCVDIIIESNKIYSEIIVKDYGIGIDKDDISHIFERFYKGKNSLKDSTGIGLALAQGIVKQSNGKIYVESKLNEGTKFTIRYYY